MDWTGKKFDKSYIKRLDSEYSKITKQRDALKKQAKPLETELLKINEKLGKLSRAYNEIKLAEDIYRETGRKIR